MDKKSKIRFAFNDLPEGIWMLRLNGELNSLNEEKAREAVFRSLEKSDYRLILELSNVPFANSAGTGLIIDAFTIARDNGGKVVVMNPVNDVLEVFDMVGLPQILDVKFGLDAAMECFGPEHRKQS